MTDVPIDMTKQATSAGLSQKPAGGGSHSGVNSSTHFVDSMEHLLAEIGRIHFLIRSRARSAQAVNRNNDVQGLVISDQEVEELLARPAGTLTFSANLKDALNISNV